MTRRHYYHIAALPALGDLGSAPPWNHSELLNHLSDVPRVRQIVAALLLGDDLVQREALLAGELEQVSPAVLTPEQVADEQPLPEPLSGPEGEGSPRRVGDAVWAAYFRYALEVAGEQESPFLRAWVGHEVTLRNALASARARALDLDPGDYLVAPDLGQTDEDLTALLGEWSAAADPLAAERVLDRARWQWLNDHDGWFTFADDEVAVYAARLMLLWRWHRVGTAASPRSEERSRRPAEPAQQKGPVE